MCWFSGGCQDDKSTIWLLKTCLMLCMVVVLKIYPAIIECSRVKADMNENHEDSSKSTIENMNSSFLRVRINVFY